MLMLLVAAVASAQSVNVSGTCPGTVDIVVEDATPDARVVMMASATGGSGLVPAGPCAGVQTSLAEGASRFGPILADGSGRIEVSPELGTRQAQWLVQAIDLDTCTVSEAVSLCGDGAATVDFEAQYDRIDLAVILDTTCSMSATLDGLRDRFPSAAGSLAADLDSLTFGLATYDDYNDSGFGSGADKPFILRQQQTTDTIRVAAALDAATIHFGGDGPESGHEAIYQAFTGSGYDQDCNSRYSADDDVFPFLPSELDAFSGRVPGVYNPTTPDGGLLGGMGFRDDALPIAVLITDNQLRDPADGYSSPGGCSRDATSIDSADAMLALGGRFVGVNVLEGNDIGLEQLQSLSRATGSLADLDGDGSEEPVVYTMDEPAAIEAVLIDAVSALARPATFESISLRILADPTSSVQGVAPEAWVDIAGGSDVPFTLSTVGPLVAGPTDYPVEVALVSGGYTLVQRTLYVDR
jgi:hypothetical protein